jgi:hypothetical protein
MGLRRTVFGPIWTPVGQAVRAGRGRSGISTPPYRASDEPTDDEPLSGDDVPAYRDRAASLLDLVARLTQQALAEQGIAISLSFVITGSGDATDTSTQALGEEAINLLFAKHSLNRSA